MEIPAASEMLERIRALPAGGPLLDAFGREPGAYLVGGAVRDLLLGGRPLDLDLAIEGDAPSAAARLGGRIVVHDRFGTSTVFVDGLRYDLARTRGERYPRPGALPEVFAAGIDEDLRRRDFTVNALAVGLGGEDAGVLRAPPHALDDLAAGLLRVLHDRSFSDDPTRLLRLTRYRSRFAFEIEQATRGLAERAVEARALDTVSGPRIGTELRLLAREPDPVAALAALGELRLDAAVHPRFGLVERDLAHRAMELLAEAGRRDLLALALAARSVPREELPALLDSLAFEASDRDAIASAASGSDALAARLMTARRASEIAGAVGGAGPEEVALAGALGPVSQAEQWLRRLRHVQLEIDGGDLLDAGIPEGPAVGRALRAALDAKLDGALSGRDQELAAALRAARSTG